jgi:DNA mismatch repair protein MLH1
LSSIPCLLEGHLPAFGGLALFMLRLVTEANWEDEKACFRSIAREVG